MYFEAAAAAVTPDPEVEVGSPKVTVLELGLGTDGFGSWCGIYGSTVRLDSGYLVYLVRPSSLLASA